MLDVNISKKNQAYLLSEKNKQISDKSVLFTENINNQAILTCRQRMPFAIIGFLVLYCIIIIKVFYTCLSGGIVISGFEQIDTQTEAVFVSPVTRADIVDANGIIIATSLPTVNLQVAPKPKIKNPEELAQKLADIFPDEDYEKILKKLKKQRYNDIKRNLSPAQQAQVNALGIPALEFVESQARIYPHDNLFSHIIGYTDIDNLGISGLEKSMHKRLTQSTKPLQLTINTAVQDTIREELSAAITKFKALGATAILSDVTSGEIIAMVSLPDYNPNIKISVGNRAMFNFATQGVYEAGSVFKTFNTALGLESKKIKVTDKFDATEPLKLKGITVTDYRGENRWLSVGEILIHSSNIGSAQIILRVGKEKQREFLENLGFSEKLSEFEVYEKAKPLFPAQKDWHEHTMAAASYGYSLSATPLHIISAFNAMINGGIYYYPTIIKGSNVPAPRRVISESTSEKMIPLLRDVVIKGSAKSANIAGYQVIGKTGTANKLVNGRYVQKKVMTSFLSAFPANSPKYSLLVVLDEPKGDDTFGFVTSGWNAAPTGGNIIKAIAPQLNIPADFTLDEQRKHIKASFEK
ncbi:MAG: penicillin-binding protein 2 [Alphaproteobacteria bacterium]|nr:penicillin-binding protein 2 [Alphaproteobacteria bacterium]